MRANTEKQQVVVTMTAREAGKMAENLNALDPRGQKVLVQLQAIFADLPTPTVLRGEVRHEFSDPLDMDPDIGAA